MENALIIFPNLLDDEYTEKLVTSVGQQRSSEILRDLTQHISAEAARVNQVDRYVFFANEIPDSNSDWPESDFIYELQSGNTIGERLSLAFEAIFRFGYKKVLFISSFFPELTFDLISKSFQILSDSDTVIGPSKDGDYYLLGLKHFVPELFNHKVWNSNMVFDSTINDFIENRLIWQELPILSRITSDEDIHLLGIKKFYRKIVDQSLFVN